MTHFLLRLLPFLFFTLTTGSLATTFDPQPFSQTLKKAPVIVRGKIGMSYVDEGKSSDGGKQIYTFYELQIEEALKGNVSASFITLRELGGEKDGIGLQVPGTAQFNRGEDVLVMLKDKNQDGVYNVHGMMMGKYDVVTKEDGTEILTGPGLLDEQWTLEQARKTIQAQNSNAQTSPVPSFSPSPTTPIVITSPSPQALQLHTPPSEGASSNWRFIFLIGIGIGVLGALVHFVRSFK